MKMLAYRKSSLYVTILVLAFNTSVIGQTYITGGSVSGTWSSAGSPFYIQGEITIPNGETLIIEPGVNVVFQGHYKLNVQGRLLAVGTQIDSIRITVANIATGWHGIRFQDTPNSNDTSKIIYCSIKYGNANTGSGFDRCGGAIMIKDFDKVLISNSLIDFNKQSGNGWNPPEATGGIYIYQASPIITNNTFSNNFSYSKSSALACVNCPNANVSNNIFINNSGQFAAVAFVSQSKGIISGNIISNNIAAQTAGGILIDCALISGSTSPLVENNIIFHNQGLLGGGICCYVRADPVLINNTIAYNNGSYGGGIYFDGNSDGLFINNILFGNTATSSGNQVNLVDTLSDPDFVFCDIQGGKEAFGGPGSGINYTGLYDNNIDSDPLFMDTMSFNFHLTDFSPCIGAGIDSIEISGEWYYAPSFDFDSNPRPNPLVSIPDMGACESPLSIPVDVQDELILPTQFKLEQNYPNPFNPVTTIKYSIPEISKVSLILFNILGEEVATLVNEEKVAGYYTVEFNASNLPSGVYFYQLQATPDAGQAGNYVDTKKMILVK